jgi:hypothetical protein
MGDILDESCDFDAVRELVPTTSGVVTDQQLERFTMLGFVEVLVKDAITDWSTIKSTGGDDWTMLKAGTACMLAMKVAKRLASSSSGSSGAGFAVGGFRETGGTINWPEKKAELMQCASAAFSAISTQTRTRMAIAVFNGPTRSESNVPSTLEAWYEKIIPRFLDWIEEGGEEND